MAWLQENYVIAVVGLLVAVVLLWFLFGRKKAEDAVPTVAPPAEPKKPLEAVKPEIVAAEPARFKPKEPAPAPVPPVTPPVVAPPPPPPPVAAPPPPPPPAPEPVVEAAPEPEAPPAPAELAPPPPAAAAEPEPAPAPAPEPAPAQAPAAAKVDNLQLIKGLGPKLAGLLNGLGVTGFQQIADWTDADIAIIDPQLGAFQGRIARDNFVDQAAYLARGDKAGFEAKYGALGGEL
ncbi:MAG: hypothetical protein ACREB7_00740 [Sphingopyxis sp.]|uniref:hypothetical protein n=1 Tax=Sphingopyxis sp. TaxID=1908224 RepID=UPI003D6D12AC